MTRVLRRTGPGVALAASLVLGACLVEAPLPTEAPTTPAATDRPTLPASATPRATPTPSPPPLEGLALEAVAEGLAQPLDVKVRPSDGALFVIEQTGVVRRVEPGADEHPVMLDIRDMVNSFSIEQGLLGFAFHPDYPRDPRVFVYHSMAGNDNVLASYQTAGDPDVLDPATRTELLVIDKEPERVRHNGGTVLFGSDRMLYLSIGDAELGVANGQNVATLPASVLRLDVDGDAPYTVPDDNPFADGADGAAPEIWWYGLRNPWRFSVDAETGLAYIADVGQERAEEINVVPLANGGLNFGWPAWEGLAEFLDVPLLEDPVAPIIEIVHDETDAGCSVTGGEVYRGAVIPELVGHYFYADWCHGWVRSFLHVDGEAQQREDWSEALSPGMVSSFGLDAEGELLVLDWQGGTIWRIVPVRR